MADTDDNRAGRKPAVNRRDVLKAAGGVGAVSLALLATEAGGAAAAHKAGGSPSVPKTAADPSAAV